MGCVQFGVGRFELHLEILTEWCHGAETAGETEGREKPDGSPVPSGPDTAHPNTQC
ncbi:hypothetical protein ACYJ1Y_13360 [Natrialbaceae archaeon A-gly3]